MQHPGELASLATSLCWVATALAFERAGERIGSLSLNVVRLAIALVLLCAYGAVTRGHAFPTDASAHEWGWLAASSLVGFVLGDFFLLRAYVELGPRLSSLMMATTPIWTTIGGLLLFDDGLSPLEIGGISCVVGGILWALSERPQLNAKLPSKRGIALALLGAFGQAGGLLLSKKGLEDGYDPFAATQIRVLVGLVSFMIIVTATGWWSKVAAAFKDKKAMLPATIGAFFGPFLGVAMSLIGVHLTPDTGVAATLMALTPVLMLPAVWFRGERVGLGGIGGALLAVFGVSLLFI